jgi:hypothetical protein
MTTPGIDDAMRRVPSVLLLLTTIISDWHPVRNFRLNSSEARGDQSFLVVGWHDKANQQIRHP